MKTWAKATISITAYFVAAVSVHLLGGVIPTNLTYSLWTFLGVAACVAYLWVRGYKVVPVSAPFVEPAEAVNPFEASKKSEEKIVGLLAGAIAGVYDNEPNDMHREKAGEIYPRVVSLVYDVVYAEMEYARHMRELSTPFLDGLESQRLELLQEHGRLVKGNFSSLAEIQWTGIKRLNDQIDVEKRRNRRSKE